MSSFLKKIAAIIDENKRILPGVIVIALLMGLLLFRWGYRRHMAAIDEIAVLEDLYSSSVSMVERGGDVARLKAQSEARVKERENGLFRAVKPSVAAAELVESFKALSFRRGIVIASQRGLPVSDKAGYTAVPVEFQFKTGLTQLKSLLYEIQSSPALLGVRELKIKVPEQNDNGRLDVRLVVEGAIKKGGV